MASRKGVKISRHCVVSINAIPNHTYTFTSKELKDRAESYFMLFLKLNNHPIRSGYVEFISTAVSSN